MSEERSGPNSPHHAVVGIDDHEARTVQPAVIDKCLHDRVNTSEVVRNRFGVRFGARFGVRFGVRFGLGHDRVSISHGFGGGHLCGSHGQLGG